MLAYVPLHQHQHQHQHLLQPVPLEGALLQGSSSCLEACPQLQFNVSAQNEMSRESKLGKIVGVHRLHGAAALTAGKHYLTNKEELRKVQSCNINFRKASANLHRPCF